MMPFRFSIIMKCIKRYSVDEDEAESELNDRIRTWIRNSSSEQNQPMCIGNIALEKNDSVLTKQKKHHQAQPLQQSVPRQSCPESQILIGSKNAEHLTVVESAVVMVTLPINHLPQIVDPQNNPLLEFQSTLAKFVPDSIENLRFHTQNLLVWKESLNNRAQ